MKIPESLSFRREVVYVNANPATQWICLLSVSPPGVMHEPVEVEYSSG